MNEITKRAKTNKQVLIKLIGKNKFKYNLENSGDITIFELYWFLTWIKSKVLSRD